MLCTHKDITNFGSYVQLGLATKSYTSDSQTHTHAEILAGTGMSLDVMILLEVKIHCA
jgi:hypothetical protein